MAHFQQKEEHDGIRLSWNIWPSTRIESSRIVVPLGVAYTPLKNIQDLPTVDYEPIRCKGQNCAAALNPYWYNIYVVIYVLV